MEPDFSTVKGSAGSGALILLDSFNGTVVTGAFFGSFLGPGTGLGRICSSSCSSISVIATSTIPGSITGVFPGSCAGMFRGTGFWAGGPGAGGGAGLTEGAVATPGGDTGCNFFSGAKGFANSK